MKDSHLPLLSLLLLLFLTPACKPDVQCDDIANPFSCAEENPDNWYWIDVDGMQCRDGSDTGIGVRLQRSSNDLIVFLQGGGACWNDTTCNMNLANYSADEFATWAGTSGYSGIFDSQSSDNPFDDWNVVFIPYCTGDLHAGQNNNIDVPGGPADQQFVGLLNVSLAMQTIAPQFTDPNRVLLIGASAGGYGTLFNYPQVAATFPNSEVSLIDDSGPLPDDDVALSDCLQQTFRDLWGIDNTIPVGCTDCRGIDGDGLVHLYPYLAATYTDGNFGLISTQSDDVIRAFWGFGQQNCTSLSPIDESTFESSITDLQDNFLVPTGNWSTFLPAGSDHVFTTHNGFNSERVDGTRLRVWCESVVNGQVNYLKE